MKTSCPRQGTWPSDPGVTYLEPRNGVVEVFRALCKVALVYVESEVPGSPLSGDA